ncbi:uncharacterized protein [Littorina saxatilis]|uniref:G-protein coupled receptors family 2 profile 2 domain-containing protein n=1 Tax=Littorina saxatilis TaxID=31220 RepID=A0AAN9BRL6_9CAEN
MSVVAGCVLLCLLSQPMSVYTYWEDAGSGCTDVQESAELCLDGSGSGDIDFMEVPLQGKPLVKTVCRHARLVTWVPDSTANDVTGYYMVQSCPRLERTGETTVSRCEIDHHNINIDEMSLLLPVTSLATNLTYFNRYCFLCTGDPGPKVTWSINVSCSDWVDLQSLGSEKDVLKTALESGHCTMNLQPPQNIRAAEKCVPENGGSGDDSETSPLPSPHQPLGIRPHPRGAPLSLLLHFKETAPVDEEEGGGRDWSDRDYSSQGGCSSGLLLRHFETRRCVDVRCSPGKRLEDGHTCQPVIGRSRGLFYSLTLNMQVFVDRDDVRGKLTSGSLSSLCSLEELIKAGVNQHTVNLHTQAYNLTGWISLSSMEKEPETVPTDLTSADLYFDGPDEGSQFDDVSEEHVDTIEKEILLGRVLVWFDFIVTSDAERMEVEESALRISQEDWHVVCGNMHARLVPELRDRQTSGHSEDTGQIALESFSEVFVETVTHPGYKDFWVKPNSVPVTVSPALLCPFLTFTKDEYFRYDFTASVTENKKKTELTLFNVTANISAAAIHTDDAGKLKICKSVLEDNFHDLLRDVDDPNITSNSGEPSFWVLLENYLSLGCVCLSLLCLAMTLVTYALFRSLRTIPGQNTMALCANLFLAQALLQFGVSWTDLKGGCIALGMLIHYFWLAAVLWMNVCSFHMHRVFTARRAARMTSTHVTCCSRRVLSYAVYAQGVPLVAVGVTSSVSILLSEGGRVGYADGDACYLSTPFLVGVAFAAPLGVVLLLNLIFFLRAVREITRTEKPAHSNNNSSAHNGYRSPSPNLSHLPPFPSTWRRSLNVCIRLSSLTGLFWTLGILAELLDLRVLRLVSVVVNGLQGVLIALSYLPTRRVARLYSQACCTCRGAKRQSASITGSSSSPAVGSRGGVTSGISTITVTLTGSSQNIAVNVGGEASNGRLHTSEV